MVINVVHEMETPLVNVKMVGEALTATVRIENILFEILSGLICII